MARLNWNAVGGRFYEAGVDRGVLYVGNQPGVAWPGLISVEEAPTGGTSRSYYLDGEMYLQVPSAEQFAATIRSYHRPKEFGPCDGMATVHSGLFAAQQRRQSFGLCYRTLVGNDVDGTDYGYKLHLVYNALAAPATVTRNTIGSSADPSTYSWKITTKPPVTPGVKNTAHLVIDSRFAIPSVLAALEDILYGSPSAAPRLPLPEELFEMFAFDIEVIDNGDGTFTVNGPDDVIVMLDETTFEITWPTAEFISEDTWTISS